MSIGQTFVGSKVLSAVNTEVVVSAMTLCDNEHCIWFFGASSALMMSRTHL